MKKILITIVMLLTVSISNGVPKVCVKQIVTNQWGTEIIKRCCCGCQLMYMVGYSYINSCGSE